jgi:hypothetical protein
MSLSSHPRRHFDATRRERKDFRRMGRLPGKDTNGKRVPGMTLTKIPVARTRHRFPVSRGIVMVSKKRKFEPIPKDFWDRPTKSNTGDSDPITIFQAVGQALNTWEQLEEKIALLAQLLFDTRDGKAVIAFQRSFGAVVSSSTRRDILMELARVFFWPPDE